MGAKYQKQLKVSKEVAINPMDRNDINPFGGFTSIPSRDPSPPSTEIKRIARKNTKANNPGINQIKKLEINRFQI